MVASAEVIKTNQLPVHVQHKTARRHRTRQKTIKTTSNSEKLIEDAARFRRQGSRTE